MNSHGGKVRLDHWQRQAYVYIRQSTLQQVHHNQESGRRQYALQDEAVAMGWAAGNVVVVDEDQGHSGQDIERPGFRRLMEAVAGGKVGGIFCLEVSRLARCSSIWHALVELCAWHDTLLIDEEGIYDPDLANDRLLLGIRGLVDENELSTLRRRMQLSREEKARRGELKVQAPTGFVHDRHGQLRFDPDEQVQASLGLFFEQFHKLQNASAVVRYFDQNDLLFPTYLGSGAHAGEIEWKALTYGRALYVLHDPVYAGAYVYGREAHSRARKPRDEQHKGGVRLGQDQWLVLQWDAFPGYISRAEYEANQQCLRDNRSTPATGGVARSGAALLSGCVVCGLCGHPMRAIYSGTDGEYVVYVCDYARRQAEYHACPRVPGTPVDHSVAQAILQALTPAELELSLQVLDTLEQEQQALERQWQQRLERARYTVNLAQRRYRQTEPENRLVARSLEREWEESLLALAETERAYAQARQQTPLALAPLARAQVVASTHDLPALWQAETTTQAERKELVRRSIADVTLTRQKTEIMIQLRWVTNAVDTWTVPLPQRGAHTDPRVIERIRKLAADLTDAEIADRLNTEDSYTAHRQPFTEQHVHSLRHTHRIAKGRRPSQAIDERSSKVQS